MGNIGNINEKICEMRQSLQDLINEKPSLLDSEVIIASQELDEALNEYNNLLNKVDKQNKWEGLKNLSLYLVKTNMRIDQYNQNIKKIG